MDQPSIVNARWKADWKDFYEDSKESWGHLRSTYRGGILGGFDRSVTDPNDQNRGCLSFG